MMRAVPDYSQWSQWNTPTDSNNQVTPNSNRPNYQMMPHGNGPTNQLTPYGNWPTNQMMPYGHGPTNQMMPFGHGPSNQMTPYGNGPTNNVAPYGYGSNYHGYGTNYQVTSYGSSSNQLINHQMNNYFQDPRPNPPQPAPVRRFPTINMRIDCNPCITHSHISSFRRNHDLNDNDGRVVQGIYTLLNSEADWVWGNSEITVHGENITVTFFAGGGANKYVVHLDGNNVVESSCREKGLRLFLRDGAVCFWNIIKGAGRVIRGALTVNNRPMLTAGN